MIKVTDQKQSFLKTSETESHLQVQRGVSVNVDRVRLNFKLALQEETDNLMVAKAGAEVERDVIFIILGIYW